MSDDDIVHQLDIRAYKRRVHNRAVKMTRDRMGAADHVQQEGSRIRQAILSAAGSACCDMAALRGLD